VMSIPIHSDLDHQRNNLLDLLCREFPFFLMIGV
jgi:hypothetical protein